MDMVCGTPGISENSYPDNIVIYPNPLHDNFQIIFDNSLESKAHSIIIRNILSQIIFETETREIKIEINLNGIALKGISILEIRNNKQGNCWF
ncbi:hypothetical protein BH11BAC1_BH11BAC1_00090 [soil metagenome]